MTGPRHPRALRRAQLRLDPDHVRWIEDAHQARIDQGLPEFIEDDETIDLIVEALTAVPAAGAGGPDPSESRGRRTPKTDPKYLLPEEGHGPA